MSEKKGSLIQDIKFDKDGLIPAVIQDALDGAVLMVGYMNEESLRLTFKTKKVTFFSRSRQSLWVKGERSGNVQEVKSIHKDCDSDTLLVKVKQIGEAACHTGNRSCFYSEWDGEEAWVEKSKPLFDPKEVYRKP